MDPLHPISPAAPGPIGRRVDQPVERLERISRERDRPERERRRNKPRRDPPSAPPPPAEDDGRPHIDVRA